MARQQGARIKIGIVRARETKRRPRPVLCWRVVRRSCRVVRERKGVAGVDADVEDESGNVALLLLLLLVVLVVVVVVERVVGSVVVEKYREQAEEKRSRSPSATRIRIR